MRQGTPDILIPHLSTQVRTTLPPLLLASRSPRRRWLLTQAHIAHEAVHPGFDDAILIPGDIRSPSQWVCALAYLKAWTASHTASHRLILGADTACVMDGRMIGTPRDADEARAMIRDFTDRDHEVVTGVALIDRRGTISVRTLFSDLAHVRMGSLTDEAIETYIASEQWMGKAGAYNLLDRLGAGWPIEYTGDPTTIMGLPMNALVRRLSALA